MTTQYYDVVVIGMELGPLTAGALLAKRGFRVLVVGQEAPADRYSCLGYQFSRRPFVLTCAESPVLHRVLKELSLGQLYQRLIETTGPAYQVVTPKVRLDVTSDTSVLKREFAREFPRAAAVADQIFETLGRIDGEINKFLANNLVIPPESFFEKREYVRAEVQNPFRSLRDTDLLGQFDLEPEFRRFLEIPVAMETAGGSSVSPFVHYRLMSSWLFNCRQIKGGRDGFRKLLADRIVGQGGDLHPLQQVAEIAVTKGRVNGIRLAGREELIGCQVVLTDLALSGIKALIPPSAWPKKFSELGEKSDRPALGYAINLGVDRMVIPAGLGHTAFVSFGPDFGDELLRVEQIPQLDQDKAALHVSCTVAEDEQNSIHSGQLRDAILDRLRWLVPFLDHHLRVIHSPYDGFGPIDLVGDAKGEAPAVPHTEDIPRWVLRQPPVGKSLGAESLHYRSGIKGLLFSGSQVLTGLGSEGELLAAWGAARIAGKTDPKRERLVRSMRSKVEL